MKNESFSKVGINELGNNFMALTDAQDLTNEYEAAWDTGLWEVVLFSYAKWFNEGKLILSTTG